MGHFARREVSAPHVGPGSDVIFPEIEPHTDAMRTEASYSVSILTADVVATQST